MLRFFHRVIITRHNYKGYSDNDINRLGVLREQGNNVSLIVYCVNKYFCVEDVCTGFYWRNFVYFTTVILYVNDFLSSLGRMNADTTIQPVGHKSKLNLTKEKQSYYGDVSQWALLLVLVHPIRTACFLCTLRQM